jgi:hypothetical protein
LLKGCPIVSNVRAHPHIARHLLLACESFRPRLPASRVLDALNAGVQAAGLPASDLCALPERNASDYPDVRETLDAFDFDTRMRSGHAVILGAAALREDTLAGSFAFEIATRARQAGVPAYAVTPHNALNPFDARILDLQKIVLARSGSALSAAGELLARLA